MERVMANLLLILFLTLVTMVPVLMAQVVEAFTNSTRRSLGRKYRGPCVAYNSIDKCWRCQPDWANNRKRLADCAQGFGQKARGGKFGEIYTVTDPLDNDMVNQKPGTLRHAVIQKEPLWIIFAYSMTIRLNQELIMASHKTIDGRGANVVIAGGAGLVLQNIENVIISNIHIRNIVKGSGGLIRDSVDHFGIRGASDGDAISIWQSKDVWVDHVSMSESDDGHIDVVQQSTDVTISNCHFIRHNHALLFGASDKDSKDRIIRVTVAYNHFGKNLTQRMPSICWGFVHVVNNDYTHWQMYAIGGAESSARVTNSGPQTTRMPKKWHTGISMDKVLLNQCEDLGRGDQKEIC